MKHRHDQPPSRARRRFLGSAAGAVATLVARRNGCAQTEGAVVVAYEDAGLAIATDFIGLSYESAILAAGDYFAPDNASVLGLIRRLGANGVIRIGGNTSADTVWHAAPAQAGPADLVITPASIDRLAAALRGIGWKLIYGLNLARGTPEEAVAEAAYVASAVGANLMAFQIGNEPDGFGRWAGVRPRTYDAAAYLAEWRTFHAAIRARLPQAPFAGPDVAAETDWLPALAAARPQGLVLLTRHYYAEGPAGSPDVTLAKLLQTNGELAALLRQLARYGNSYGLPFRIVEASSVYNEGEPGVSDTLGAALWGLEFMFAAAAAGAAGVNFHAGVHNRRPDEDKAYTPIARSAAGRYQARPLYYGMLMFAQAASGTLLPTRVAGPGDDLAAFAVRNANGGVRVCLINKAAQDARVRIDPGRRFVAASLMRLTGPAVDATAGVTLGGSEVDAFGGWVPVTGAVVHAADGEVIADVPAASAALVIFDV